MIEPQRVVALGGGHGLAATLRALAICGVDPVAVVGTGDDGGSSGRLRSLGFPPPGDLRMALAALSASGDDDAGQSMWLRVVQHRFHGGTELDGHALGNLLIVALWEESGDIVGGLDAVADLLGSRGRVLPNCLEPVTVIADVDAGGVMAEIRGQARLTATSDTIVDLRIEPALPQICRAAVQAIASADLITFGPGSWFTSVLPHLVVPQIRQALVRSRARHVLVLNAGPQAGETQGFTADRYLSTWAALAPDVRLDFVIADPASMIDEQHLREAAACVGAQVLIGGVLTGQGTHDPHLLARALAPLLAGDSSTA